MLENIKALLDITDDALDTQLNIYIDAGVSYLENAGVKTQEENKLYQLVIALFVKNYLDSEGIEIKQTPIFEQIILQLRGVNDEE